ncbi:MAG: ribosome silencing factor [Actinomycetia bacterium]|nr:ribosome silencing factor [Actinomycetes bacterium]
MTAGARAVTLARQAAHAAADKLGTDIVAIDMSEMLSVTDVFLIVSARNEPQMDAIVDAIDEALLRDGVTAIRREGERGGRWVLLDFFDLVVHVQNAEERTVYSLERLWRDAPRLDLGLEDTDAPARRAALSS